MKIERVVPDFPFAKIIVSKEELIDIMNALYNYPRAAIQRKLHDQLYEFFHEEERDGI